MTVCRTPINRMSKQYLQDVQNGSFSKQKLRKYLKRSLNAILNVILRSLSIFDLITDTILLYYINQAKMKY